MLFSNSSFYAVVLKKKMKKISFIAGCMLLLPLGGSLAVGVLPRTMPDCECANQLFVFDDCNSGYFCTSESDGIFIECLEDEVNNVFIRCIFHQFWGWAAIYRRTEKGGFQREIVLKSRHLGHCLAKFGNRCPTSDQSSSNSKCKPQKMFCKYNPGPGDFCVITIVNYIVKVMGQIPGWQPTHGSEWGVDSPLLTLANQNDYWVYLQLPRAKLPVEPIKVSVVTGQCRDRSQFCLRHWEDRSDIGISHLGPVDLPFFHGLCHKGRPLLGSLYKVAFFKIETFFKNRFLFFPDFSGWTAFFSVPGQHSWAGGFLLWWLPIQMPRGWHRSRPR